jgi:hypothetical protein
MSIPSARCGSRSRCAERASPKVPGQAFDLLDIEDGVALHEGDFALGFLAGLAVGFGARDPVGIDDNLAEIGSRHRGEACQFRYNAHQSDVTMGMYSNDYELTYRGVKVKLKEHIGFGTYCVFL